MRSRHPVGCTCDQPWYHQPPAGQLGAARRNERERMNAARQVGKVLSNLARERHAEEAEAVPP